MKDPTQTSSIRQAWVRQFNARFRKLRGQVNTLFSQGRVPFDEEFAVFFAAWFERATLALLGGDWQRKYVTDAYIKGLVTSGLVRPESAIAVALSGEHLKSIDALTKAVDAELQGVLSVMQAQSVERVQRGISGGIPKSEITAGVKDRISKIGNTRGAFLANTKTPYSANLAKINVVGASQDIEFLWVTRQDERVRTDHALRNRKVYSKKAAANLIGEPGCRCSIVPVRKDEKLPKGYREIRREGLAISEAAQRERKFFATLRRGERAEGLDGDF